MSAINHPAVVNLRQYQKPHDPDGIEIGVSRQAVDETLALLDEFVTALDNLVTGASVAMTEDREFFRRKIELNIRTAQALVAKAVGAA